MEKLIIENFGGIKYLELKLNQINILIGPQATGKSVCAKLLYFFKKFGFEFIKAIETQKTESELEKSVIQKFTEFFPIHTFPKSSFYLRYELNDYFVQIVRQNNSEIKLDYSDYFKKELENFKLSLKKRKEKQQNNRTIDSIITPIEIRENFIKKFQKDVGNQIGYNQIFIPAGRSFFAILQKRIFSFLSEGKEMDPFLIEFGSFYEKIKTFPKYLDKQLGNKIDDGQMIIDDLIERIIGGKYSKDAESEYLTHPDGRKINISYSSSGQQETLPLTIMLPILTKIDFYGEGATIYIEEPEAHIFPSTQKKIVELISYIFNRKKSHNFQFFITTHSPYILSSFNNLMFAGMIESNIDKKQKEELYSIVPKKSIIRPNLVNALSLSFDNYQNLINSDTNLIDTNIIDIASNEISIQFDNLLNIK